MHGQVSYLKTRITEDSLFGKSQKTGLEYVLKLDPDRLLAPSYIAMGQRPKASCYGGWESQQIQGHSLGHYLSALSAFYESTGDSQVKERLDYTVECIKKLQRNDGYFAGISSMPFDRAFNGDINAERFALNGWWVPWYSIHKIYAGLVDAYLYGKNEDALQIVKGMADWAIKGCESLSEEQFQAMLNSEHGGMLKVYADLYGITQESRYLEMAERFVHKEIVKPLIKKQDRLQGYHANTQIPKIIGLARLYEVTGKTEYRTACEFFFDTVINHRSYAIGGNSVGEHFGPQDSERLDKTTTETCNTYNMLELAEHIFAWNKDSSIADYYEKALYNHILASQEPVTGAKTYYVSLLPGFYKVYGSFENSFWCCTGTGMENPARYNRFIAKEIDGRIYINLFIDSTVSTNGGGKIKIESSFPYQNKCIIKVLKSPSSAESLVVRNPSWIEEKLSDKKSDYVLLSDSIKEGDFFEINLSAGINVRRAKDRSGNFSIFYGPVILGADLGSKGIPGDVAGNNQNEFASVPCVEVSTVISDPMKASDWVKIINPETLEFSIGSENTGNHKELKLKPFYDLHHTRYTVYFFADNPEEDLRKKKYDKCTLDYIECGRQQSEVDHRYKNNGSVQGYIPQIDRAFRSPDLDGGFSYKMKFSATEKNALVITTYGESTGNIKILIDDYNAGEINLKGDKGKTLFDTKISIPESVMKEKAKDRKKFSMTVSVESSDGKPCILEIRTVKD